MPLCLFFCFFKASRRFNDRSDFDRSRAVFFGAKNLVNNNTIQARSSSIDFLKHRDNFFAIGALKLELATALTTGKNLISPFGKNPFWLESPHFPYARRHKNFHINLPQKQLHTTYHKKIILAN